MKHFEEMGANPEVEILAAKCIRPIEDYVRMRIKDRKYTRVKKNEKLEVYTASIVKSTIVSVFSVMLVWVCVLEKLDREEYILQLNSLLEVLSKKCRDINLNMFDEK